MGDKLTKGQTPQAGFRARKTGSHLVPEGASPRMTGPKRGQYPKGTVPAPGQRVAPGKSGDSQSNTMKSSKVPPIATREGGGDGKPVGSRGTPFARSGGSDKSRI